MAKNKDWDDKVKENKEAAKKEAEESEQDATYENIFGIDGKKVKKDDVEAQKARDAGEQEILDAMNKEHMYIEHIGGKNAITCKYYNEVTDREEIEFVPIETFKNNYANQFVYAENIKKGQDETLTKGEFWFKHPNKNTRKGVIFDPSKSKDWNNYLNLWEGFKTPNKIGSWHYTKRHMWKILSNKNPEKFKYLFKWLAWTVQNPQDQAEVAVILTGKKGAGKSFLFSQFVQLFGPHGMTITDRSRLSGKFSGHFRLLCFLFGDEVYYPGDKDIEGRIKAIITERYIDTEAKFQNPTTTRNRLHIAMSTNNEWVIPTGHDERRFYINKVSDKYTKAKSSKLEIRKYFSKLWNEMENGGREAMLHNLLNYNLHDWHPRYDVPETEELNKQRGLSLNLLQQTIKAFLEEGFFPGEKVEYNTGNKYKIEATPLYQYLEEQEPNLDRFSSVKKAEIIKLLGATKERMGGSGRSRWVFPELKEMRINWDECYGKNTEWDNLREWATRKGEY